MTEVTAPTPSDLTRATVPRPCVLVILGAAGDLALRKLFPALYNLDHDGLLPDPFAVVGLARRAIDAAAFRAMVREGVDRHSRRAPEAETWDRFAPRIHYVEGSFDDPVAFAALRGRLEAIEAASGTESEWIFYLSVPPTAIVACVKGMSAAGLLVPRGSGQVGARIIVEKPVGRDLASARAINDAIGCEIDEARIFRIDHYLGKETVQNILVLRFANSILEPLWNQKYIDHVQITVAESEGVGTRAGYYEEAGALRDMVQNHILQVLCLVAMEPPWSLAPEVVRDHKMGVLNCLRPMNAAEVERNVVRAQYGPGSPGGHDVPGYRREDRVRPDSTTETFVGIRAFIDNWRWAGVPFYIRTGKSLPHRMSEVAIRFKDAPPVLFHADANQRIEPNVLVVRIQPDEGLSLSIACKQPGGRVDIQRVEMNFQYDNAFQQSSPEAYERLLLDVMAGDATLFMRRDAVEASWTWVGGILDAWAASGARWLPEYAAGTWGPVEAERLIAEDGRSWRVA